jgi:hypothetical protein
MSDITLAASDQAFEELFDYVVEKFTYSKSEKAEFGPFSASYAIALHLENGSVTLTNEDTIDVSGLKVVFDTLKAEVCFTLPGWCVGGFCIVPDPWGECLVEFPGICIGGFSICPGIDLSGLVSDVTKFDANLRASYYINPKRLPEWTDLEAEMNGVPNMWQIFINPTLVDINPIDVPATIANVLENAIKSAIEDAIPGWVPEFVVELLWDIIGPIVSLIVDALDIVGEINEWFENLLNETFGIVSGIETALADFFAEKNPIEEIEDPFPVLKEEGGLIPVKIPIRELAATIDSQEMIVTANVGVV